MTDCSVFLARAAEARHDAEQATLENVRDRCLRAESAWMAMADRAQRVDQMRADTLAEKEAAKADA